MPAGDLNAFYWYQIFALDSAVVEVQEACLFKYITVAEFHIYAQCGEDAPKRGGWRPCIK